MYSKEDLEKVNAQIRREQLQLYVPAGLLIAGGIVAYPFIPRSEPVQMTSYRPSSMNGLMLARAFAHS